jgi:UDP-2-acetamido-3-amino-2,3-dideoxy-glucuronate N-acetyltransferase
MSAPAIHPTAEIEPGVEVGPGAAIWSHVHVRAPARIGAGCIVGEKTYIAYGVTVGPRVKLNAFVYVCTGVSIDTGAMVGAATVFTNDRYPRATTPDLGTLLDSGPNEATQHTAVREGATIGARCVVGGGLEVGRFAMVGMGSTVTHDVPAFHLAVGSPARAIACVCRCGEPFVRFPGKAVPDLPDVACPRCELRYRVEGGEVTELGAAA